MARGGGNARRCAGRDETSRQSSSSNATGLVDEDSDSEILNDARMKISVQHGTLMPSNKVSLKITFIFKQAIDDKGVNWKSVSEEKKRLYFDELKKYFTWGPQLDGIVHAFWLQKAAGRYRDMVCRLKKRRERPTFINEHAWPHWVTYWDSDKIKEKSDKARETERLDRMVQAHIWLHIEEGPNVHNNMLLTWQKRRESPSVI